ncbi:MAG TPA: NUDIX domain-containing protein [Thermoanaerobaculia bacterium]|nr:NUDIX domain-containing protein [Thermoanaerobaculia bacterium]
MTERVDIVTPDGVLTGRAKAKDDVHRDGDWHRCAHLWLLTPDGRILVQRRALSKQSWPGMWDVSVAGHISAGESSRDAVLRETQEELGLTLAHDEPQWFGTVPFHATLRDGAYIENEIHDLFFVRREIDSASLRLDPLEVAEVALVTPDELENLDLVPHPAEYALLRETVLRSFAH